MSEPSRVPMTREEAIELAGKAGSISMEGALALVHRAAELAQIPVVDAGADQALARKLERQQQAIDTLHDFLVNHGESIDDRFDHAIYLAMEADPLAVLTTAMPSPPETEEIRTPIDAIRMCLALGADAVSQELLSWKWKIASAYVAWLVETHGAEIEAEVKTIDIAPAMAMG